MKKTMAVLAVLMIVSSSAFAGGSTNAKDKAYADCLVNAPKLCGGSSNVNWNNQGEVDAFKSCTEPKYKECYRVYLQGK